MNQDEIQHLLDMATIEASNNIDNLGCNRDSWLHAHFPDTYRYVVMINKIERMQKNVD